MIFEKATKKNSYCRILYSCLRKKNIWKSKGILQEQKNCIPKILNQQKALNDKQIELPKIYKIAPVVYTYQCNPLKALLANKRLISDRVPLAVPSVAIKMDANNEYYVLKIHNDAEDSDIVEVEKVRVVLGSIEREFNLGTRSAFKLRSLKNAGTLNKDDVVAVLENKSEYMKLYDGVELKIVKKQLASERITHKRADEIAIPIDKISLNYY
jgi:hypothetical protein